MVALAALSSCAEHDPHTTDTTAVERTTTVKKQTDTSAAPSPAGAPTGKRPGMGDDAMVVFRFRDSSVPPPFHRSYQLTVTRTTTSIVVKDYTDVLAERSVPTTEAAWTAILLGYAPIAGLVPEEPARGCTGGTGVGLQVRNGEAIITSFDAEVCGGVNSAIADQVREWIAPARSLLPPMAELAP